MVNLAADIIDKARTANTALISAESCTGGMIASNLSAVAGASDVYMGSIVSYSNAFKTSLLYVPPALLQLYGAVSPQVACAMAEGGAQLCLNTLHLPLNQALCVAVTGIAGPAGGTEHKPVGTVHMAISRCTQAGVYNTHHAYFNFAGKRAAIRQQACEAALQMILDHLS